MIIHNAQQGSEAWHALRASVDGTASEAPAMMNESKYQKRDDLLKQKSTGIAKEVNSFTQSLFDKGHAAESSIRPYIESEVGEELYPVTGTIEIDGLVLLASFDGLTMMEDKGFEHKLWNEALAASVRANDLDPHYYWQLEQQLLVSGAEFILFATSDGTAEKCVFMRYYPVPGRAERLVSGWKQFKIDLANYVLPETEAPKAVAEPVDSLPAIRYAIDLSKGISINSNLDVFKEAAQRLVEKSKEELITDQDFANAGARVKECEKAEKNIDSLIDRVLGDLGDADKFKRDMESIKEFIRQSRLNQEKKIKKRNEERKIEIVAEGKAQLDAYIKALNVKLAPLRLPIIAADFAGAIKGKSKFENMISAVNDKVAAAKIEADAAYTKIGVNVETLNEIAGEHIFLFPDLQALCANDHDHFTAVVKLRIAEHQKEQDRLAEEKRLAEENRIAAEKAEQDRLAEEKRKADELAIQKETAKAPAPVAAIEAPLAATDENRFEQDFLKVFDGVDVEEAFVDMSDFQRGKVAGYEEALQRFDECQRSGLSFREVIASLINKNKIPARAA